MTYHFERVGDSGDWFEMRDNGDVVEYRDFCVPNWSLWSNTQTLEVSTKGYRNSPSWVVTVIDGPIVEKIPKTDVKAKCTCPWDGPTGVYAVGCKCRGI